MPEAFLLYEYLAGQPKDRRESVLARFDSTKEVLHANGFGERSLLPEENNEKDVVGLAIDYFKLGLPCPFLEAESCSIHPFRPTACREHLVTSPPEMCSVPGERAGTEVLYNIQIRPVLAPVSLTQALATLYAQLHGTVPVLLPLPLALDNAAEQREAREMKYPAEDLFSSFFAILDPLLRSRIEPL